MPFTDPGLTAGVDGIAAAGRHISFHTADPQTDGRAEVVNSGSPASTYARQQTTWAAAAASTVGGVRQAARTGAEVSASGLPGSTTLTHWGVWSAVSGGVFLFGGALAQPEAFGAAGGTMRWTPQLVVSNPA